MCAVKNKATFPGYYSSLVKIAELVREASEKAGFDSATTYNIELAVDEAVTNIIEHAYGDEGIGDVELEYLIDETGLTIDLRDHGQPFFPEEVETPDIQAPLEKRENHGLGIFLIRQIMDEVHYRFDEAKGNRLTLIKHRDKGV
jgi:serine/threonine-protein kinase RsbW